MSYHEQPVIDRDVPVSGPERAWDGALNPATPVVCDSAAERRVAERAARASLRAQITRLEHERSAIVAERFPYVPAPGPLAQGAGGPTLLGLGELECSRDRLAGAVQQLRAQLVDRVEHERRAHEQLQRMRLEPGRYKFARLPVRDLGQGVCGVWEVRPRLGLIGMLAGWWELKLSSGCPLAMGSRSRRGPGSRQ